MQGDQKTSNIVTAVPVLPLTGVPTGLRVTGVKADEISVAWDPLPGATYYQVEYQLASLAYEPMTRWSTYGSPPAHILGTEVEAVALAASAPRCVLAASARAAPP